MPRGLIYFADPMCSWCWGFSKVIQKVQDKFSAQLPIRIMMGGLYAGASKALDPSAKEDLKEHWQDVAILSGAEFDFRFFDREEFVYNTEPACRAIVLVQQHEPASTLAFLRQLQQAFYCENNDITDPEVLGEEALKFGFNPDKFSKLFKQSELIAETQKHFAITKHVEVTGFPTLFAVDDTGQHTITSGYQPEDKIYEHIQGWLNESIAREAESSTNK
ncbi:Thioredoxin [hydrothermal vent metagenome]|uniref:Thioredoxin n=1 Tax=hydrothermal vent metagenome TaxID=652676 RepID=A0A3B1B3I8_9ZZZZ